MKPQPPTKKTTTATVVQQEDLKQKEIDDLKRQNSEISAKLKEAENNFLDSYQRSKDLEKAIVIWITALIVLFTSLFYNATEKSDLAGGIFGWTFFGLFIYLMATGFKSLLTIFGAYMNFLF